jgi:hypothetical protein
MEKGCFDIFTQNNPPNGNMSSVGVLVSLKTRLPRGFYDHPPPLRPLRPTACQVSLLIRVWCPPETPGISHSASVCFIVLSKFQNVLSWM